LDDILSSFRSLVITSVFVFILIASYNQSETDRTTRSPQSGDTKGSHYASKFFQTLYREIGKRVFFETEIPPLRLQRKKPENLAEPLSCFPPLQSRKITD
jgi:hypothetical protein